MSKVEMHQMGEALSSEQEYVCAKQAFEEVAADFDRIVEVEDAWQHLDNWNFKSSAYRSVKPYTHSAESKMQAVKTLASAHRILAETFANLTEASQRNLVEQPIITFECRGGESKEAERSSFEFNLPEIVVGFKAWQRLEDCDRQWRQAVKAGRVEMQADEYGRTHWQSKTCFHDSVDLASEFLIAGKECFYITELNLPKTQLTLARIGQMEKLSEIYLKALSHGDEATRLALHQWILRVNNRILHTCERTEVATRMFQIKIDAWVQDMYPHEGALIPIGQTMIRKRNAREIEHDHYITNC